MVEMQEQAFAAIQKAEPKEVVVDESGDRTHDDVEHAEAARAGRFRGHLCAQRRVAVHVVNVVGEGGIGMVDESVFELTGLALQPDVFMDQAVFEAGGATAE